MQDETLQKCEVFDEFDSYWRSPETPIKKFLHKFDLLYNKLNSYGTTISDDLLGYKLLKAANLSSDHEKLAKATCELKHASMSEQLKRIFSDSKRISADSSTRLCVDEINHTDHQKQQPFSAPSSGYRGRPPTEENLVNIEGNQLLQVLLHSHPLNSNGLPDLS